MPRASQTQKAERLNRARDLLLHGDQLSDALVRLAQDCSISPRQAHRYLDQAQELKQPVPPSEANLAFTVKLPHSLVRRVRTLAAAKDCPSARWSARAVLALPPRERVGEPKPIGDAACSWEYRFDRLLAARVLTCIIESCVISIEDRLIGLQKTCSPKLVL